MPSRRRPATTGLRRLVAAVAAAGLALGMVSSLPAVPARAAVPPVTPTTTVVEVTVGGDRFDVNGVTSLQGVQLGLFTSASGGTQITTCTSDADGDCSLVVPNTGDGGSNRGSRPYIRQLGVPTGWFANPSLRTGNSGGTTNTVQPYVFQTPALYGNQYQRFAFFSAGDNNQPKASGGTWQNSRNNPVLPSSCGLDVALILDLSGSISGQLGQLKTAANTFTDALVGTPSRMSLYSFATLSPAGGATQNYPSLTSVSTQNQANAFKARYSGWSAGGSTNWDRGLAVPGSSGDQVDVAVMITDGNPTVESQPATGPSSSTRFKEVESGIFSANLLKSRGTRVLAVGVGSGVTASATALNLAAISGPIKYNAGPPPNQDVADYYQSTSFTEVGAALRALALGNCASSISVTKEIVPFSNTGENVTGSTPAGAGWAFLAAGTPGIEIDGGAERITTADGTGTVNFPLTFSNGVTTGPVTVVEQQQTDYTLVTQNGQNAVCRNLDTGAAVSVTNVPDQPGFTVNASSTDPIGCTMYNRAPAPQASVQVDKQWVINGTTYDNGEQPDGFQADLTLSGPGDAPASPQGWGVPRTGYSAADTTMIDEEVTLPPGSQCTAEDPTITRTNAPPIPPADLPYQATLLPEANEYLITNTVTCESRLTLVKQVLNGNAEATEWTLSATTEEGGALPGPSGTTGTPAASALVTPDVPYDLAETDGDPNYEQQDVDQDPANRPWLCQRVIGDVVVRGYVDGSDATVSVPLGASVTCTAFNQTARLGVRKLVDDTFGGDAEPSDFTLTATPIDPPDGVVAQSVTGSENFQYLEVRPGVTYVITETGPGNYTASTTCEIVTDNPTGDPGPRADGRVAVPALETAECTVTNAFDPAVLTLVKRVSGGPRDPDEWTLTADGPQAVSGVTGAPAVTRVEVPAGTYTLGEDGPTDYTGSDWSCQNGTDTPFTTAAELELAVGDDVTCTITNAYVSPPNRARLTLVKEVDNTGGGRAEPTDWTLVADGPRAFSGRTGSAAVTRVEVPAGTYTLSESDGPGDYTASDWSCQNRTETPIETATQIEVPAGSDVRCVLTNSYAGVGPIPPIPPDPPVPPLPPTGGPGFWPLVAGAGLVLVAAILLLVSRLTRPRAGRSG